MPRISSLLSGVTALLLAGIFVAASAPPAAADPHAMFYTAIGQQQLFFNMLAALDQADYVETPEQRNELLEQRAAAGFAEETDPRIRSTETELAALLTRSVTLEGQDLWSAYLAHQFALEVARQRATDELVRVYCQRGLGIKDCDKDADAKEIEEGQKKAFVKDPVEWAQLPAQRGAFSALFSGSQEIEEEQQRLLSEDKDVEQLPLAIDESVKEWRKAAPNEDFPQSAAASVFERLFMTPRVISEIWDYVDQDGRFSSNTDENDINRLGEHEYAIAMLLHNKKALGQIAQDAAGRVATQLQGTTSDGAIPDFEIQPSEKGDITVKVDVPAHAKVAFAQEVINTIGQTEQNRKFANPEESSVTGSQPAVQSASSSSPQAPTAQAGQAGGVAGIQSTSLSPQVAGDQDNTRSADALDFNRKAQKPLDLATNLAPFHDNQGERNALYFLGVGKDKGGANIKLENTVKDFAKNMVDQINNLLIP